MLPHRHRGQPPSLPLPGGAVQSQDTCPSVSESRRLCPGRGDSAPEGWLAEDPILLILAKTLRQLVGLLPWELGFAWRPAPPCPEALPSGLVPRLKWEAKVTKPRMEPEADDRLNSLLPSRPQHGLASGSCRRGAFGTPRKPVRDPRLSEGPPFRTAQPQVQPQGPETAAKPVPLLTVAPDRTAS